MCGIAGILAPGTRDAAPIARAVDAMIGAIQHRGPDGVGRWHTTTASGCVAAFGHARLAIIDLSPAGRQPMVRGNVVATYNGEIYNFRALREQLRADGASFATDSDTEVLLAGYERWGAAVVDRLEGMFAAGIWDGARERLVLMRDRLGIKPLYYHQEGGRIVFASEVRALLASRLVQAELDTTSLWHYLGYQTAPTPATLLRGVRMLEPGHVLEVGADGRAASRRYWTLLRPADGDAPTPAAARSKVGELLHHAVSSHLVSDVPVGVFLSGGIDSGALISVLGSIGVRPSTFTVGLAEDALADESAEARRVADLFRTDHTEIRLREADILEMLPDVLAAVDHPSGDGANSFVVSRVVHDHGLKVALSGLGGDEIFGGYASFRRLARVLPAARHMKRSPVALRRAAAGLLRRTGGGVATDKAATALEGGGSLAEFWPVTRQLFSARDRRNMLADGLAPASQAADAYEPMLSAAFAEAPGAGLWAQISYAEARAYMHDVLLRDTDQMSMAHGLEVRVPFLDHALASYVVSLPDDLKAGDGSAKSLLVGSLPTPLPDGLAGRPKRGFTLPFDAWMRGALRPYCEAQLGERGLDGRGILKPGEATRLWSRFIGRANGVTWSRVWSLVALNAWLDRQNVRMGS